MPADFKLGGKFFWATNNSLDLSMSFADIEIEERMSRMSREEV